MVISIHVFIKDNSVFWDLFSLMIITLSKPIIIAFVWLYLNVIQKSSQKQLSTYTIYLLLYFYSFKKNSLSSKL